MTSMRARPIGADVLLQYLCFFIKGFIYLSLYFLFGEVSVDVNCVLSVSVIKRRLTTQGANFRDFF